MNKSILTIFSLALTMLCSSCSEFVPMNYTDCKVFRSSVGATFLAYLVIVKK